MALDGGTLHLDPPLPGDAASLTSDEALQSLKGFQTDGNIISGPTVVLARYTDDAEASSSAFANDTAPYPPQDPNHQLVVAVLLYGPQQPLGGGPTGISDGAPTFNATTLLALDPNRGRMLWGASFPGELPHLSTSPGGRRLDAGRKPAASAAAS